MSEETVTTLEYHPREVYNPFLVEQLRGIPQWIENPNRKGFFGWFRRRWGLAERTLNPRYLQIINDFEKTGRPIYVQNTHPDAFCMVYTDEDGMRTIVPIRIGENDE